MPTGRILRSYNPRLEGMLLCFGQSLFDPVVASSPSCFVPGSCELLLKSESRAIRARAGPDSLVGAGR